MKAAPCKHKQKHCYGKAERNGKAARKSALRKAYKSAAAALRFGNGNNRADSIDFFWHKSSPAKMLCGQATANTANAQGVSIRLIIMLCAFQMALYIS